MNRKYYMAVAVILLALCVFGYWEYSHIGCTNLSREYVNKEILDHGPKSADSIKTAYDLQYKICMGRKGL